MPLLQGTGFSSQYPQGGSQTLQAQGSDALSRLTSKSTKQNTWYTYMHSGKTLIHSKQRGKRLEGGREGGRFAHPRGGVVKILLLLLFCMRLEL